MKFIPIYKQSLLLLDSSATPISGEDVAVDSSTVEAPEGFLSPLNSNNLSMESEFLTYQESLTGLRTSEAFSNVPILWASELQHDYEELGLALSELEEMGEEAECGISHDVYIAACYVASQLMNSPYPAPKVFTHGPKSVVFNWTNGGDNLYLTISSDRVSALVSSPQRIRLRRNLELSEFGEPFLAIGSLKSALRNAPETRLLSSATPDQQAEVVLLS